MAFVGKLTACVLVLVFAAGASAATCADGSNPGSNGCCAATQECPPCLSAGAGSSGDSGTTCSCHVCAGDTVTIDSACNATNCATDQTGLSTGDGCEICTGDSGTCMTSASACNMYLQASGLSIDSSGLLSVSAAPSCDACCPTGICETSADASKPECKACAACNEQGTPCPSDSGSSSGSSDSAAASLGSGALGTTLLAATTTALLRGLLF